MLSFVYHQFLLFHNPILLKYFLMGVCIGACSRVQKMQHNIGNQEKNQIQNQIATDPFDAENCNYETAEGDQFKAKEQPQQQGEKLEQVQEVPQKAEAEVNNQEDVLKQDKKQESPQIENPRNRKYEENGVNLLNRGKSERDNQLIASTMNAKQLMKLSAVQLDNGITYEGQWKDAMREGSGTQIWADGSKYVGEWKNNKANGKGTLYHSDCDVYEGEWLNDKANGHGVYTHSNGAKYIGQWKDDKQNGHGIEEWLDGQKYEGQYKNGTKTGKGLLKFLDGSYYQGEFLNNQIHGKGVYVWCKNRKYDGQWQNNRMHGTGVTQWTDGRKYEGQYVNDKKHGMGTFHWPDGRKYHGAWKDGKQHGRGEYFLASGDKKLGQWVEGKRIKWIQEANPKQK